MINMLFHTLTFSLMGVVNSPLLNSDSYRNCIQVDMISTNIEDYVVSYSTGGAVPLYVTNQYVYDIHLSFKVQFNSKDDYLVNFNYLNIIPQYIVYHDSSDNNTINDEPTALFNGNLSFNTEWIHTQFDNIDYLNDFYFWTNYSYDGDCTFNTTLATFTQNDVRRTAAYSSVGYSAVYDPFYTNIGGLSYNSVQRTSNVFYGFKDGNLSSLLSYAMSSNDYFDGFDYGKDVGYAAGYDDGYDVGFSDGWNEGFNVDSTALTIFSGILAIGTLPINIFLGFFNFTILGINFSELVASMLSVCVCIIVIKRTFSTNGDS